MVYNGYKVILNVECYTDSSIFCLLLVICMNELKLLLVLLVVFG